MINLFSLFQILDSLYGVPILKCNCQAQLVLKSKKDGKGFYLGCRTYPDCKITIWFPSSVKDAQATDDICENVIFKSYYIISNLI
jgi:ssDNA-binding Zn-finger/Zn-ribbon topoisomerase 1